MRLHVPSLLVGAALVTLVGLLSAQQVVNSPKVDVRIVEPVEAAPHPRDYVRIEQGTPYTVPSGKLLALTSVGISDNHNDTQTRVCQVLVNGAPVWSAGLSVSQPASVIPPGFVVPAGGSVDLLLVSGSFDCVAIGYLTNE